MPRHFLSLMDLSSKELDRILRRAIELKSLRREGRPCETLKGKVLGLIFEKSSDRKSVV